MLHPEYPVVSFLSVLLLLCSAPSHIRARNIATISLHLWLAVLSIIRGINSIAWADNVEIKLLVWCDITTKIDIGFTLAIPASALCIMVHLENITSARAARITTRDKRRRQIFEFVMCFVVPIIFMALHYIVQGHRFDIYQDQGCFPNIYVSLPAVFILWVPPFIFALASFIFAALSLRYFLRHRISFSTHLHNTSISPQRYFRLMLFALIEMIWDLGTNIWILWSNLTIPLRPWVSWDDVHSNFSRVQPLPYILLPQSAINADVFVWWILPVSCFLVFAIFGTGREAMADYRAVFYCFRSKILRQKMISNLDMSPLSSMSQSLPTIRRNVHVTIPFAPDNIPVDDNNDSPKGPSSIRSSASQSLANQAFDRRSLSRSSDFTEASFEAGPAFPPALPIPGISTETPSPPIPNDIHSSPPHIHSARVSVSSDLKVSVSRPFSCSKQSTWRSEHSIPPPVVRSKQMDYNDCIDVGDDKSPV